MLQTSASFEEIEVLVEFVADVDVTQSLSAFLLCLFLFVFLIMSGKAKANYAEVQKRVLFSVILAKNHFASCEWVGCHHFIGIFC